jgi:hypothetical protein
MTCPAGKISTIGLAAEPFRFASANRPRLARYLELPSVAVMDEITAAEIAKLDERRDELLSFAVQASAVQIEHLSPRSIKLEGVTEPIESAPAYISRLDEENASDLIIAAFTIGGRVDEIVTDHLSRDELFEAFVLKQWSAAMAEQARAWLSERLSRWAAHRGRSVLPYDGPGYNGWPLESIRPLMKVLDASAVADGSIRVTESCALLPTNSMVLVYGVSARAVAVPRRETLAQCHRCAMRNCRYRMMPQSSEDRLLVEVH